jgi:hypothetical protein
LQGRRGIPPFQPALDRRRLGARTVVTGRKVPDAAAHPCRLEYGPASLLNEEGERVGWLNRIFGYVYQVRLVGKRMKAWNKRVYYAVKYLLIGGIIPGFLATAFA